MNNLKKNFISVLLLPVTFFNFFTVPDIKLYSSSSSSYYKLPSISSLESISSLLSSVFKAIKNFSHLEERILVAALSISQNKSKMESFDLFTILITGNKTMKLATRSNKAKS